jgi:predicted transcriptional regulator
MMNEAISTLMQRLVRCVDLDDTVAQVEQLLADEGLTWAPVLDSGSVAIGVVSASDLLQFHAQQRDPNVVRAWQLCTYKPITVTSDTPVPVVAQGIHHVVVANDEGVCGVVSSLDFVRRVAGMA